MCHRAVQPYSTTIGLSSGKNLWAIASLRIKHPVPTDVGDNQGVLYDTHNSQHFRLFMMVSAWDIEPPTCLKAKNS